MSLARYLSKLGALLNSNGQVQTAAVADGAVSFSKLLSTDWTKSLSGNGYQKLPSGLIIQWGSAIGATGGSYTTVTLPTTFPTAMVSLAGVVNGITAGNRFAGGFVNNSTIRVGSYSGSTWAADTVVYIAIGY